jgi:N-methylhydantoinase A
VDRSLAVLECSAELRYRGQGHAIEVTLPDPRAGSWAARTRAAFEARYRTLYDRIEPAGEVECVTWRVVARGPRPTMHAAPVAATPSAGAAKGTRPVFCTRTRAFRDAAVYDRYRLVPGLRIAGPAVVEERESTAVVPADATAWTEAGHLVIECADEGGTT